jgi:hypothetical protein
LGFSAPSEERAPWEGDVSRIAKQLLAASLALTLFLSGTAMGAAMYPTTLGFKASRTSIHKGQKVVFSGKLKAPFAKCKKFSTVTLYRNGDAVKSKTTSEAGKYSFKRNPSKTRTWQVKFGGKSGGVHPNQWVCKSSHSEKIQVKVTS